MKTFKYFLALPLALSAVTACGGSNYKETSYEDAIKVADNYAESIKANKASSIEVGGQIDKIDIKGDATWWSYESQEESITKETLLSLIPNFSFTDGELNIGKQELVSCSIPSSLVSLANILASGADNMSTMVFLIGSSLPKFPMNSRLLLLLNGYKEFVYKDKEDQSIMNVDWDKMEPLKWEKADVKYFTAGGKLKITIDTADIDAFFDEIRSRSKQPKPHEALNDEPEKQKNSGSFSITTNNIGYIDSLSVNCKIENLDEELDNSNIYYLKIKGDLEMNFTLNFKQKISSPITLKYQLTEYRIAGATESPDCTYYYGDGKEATPIGLKFDKVSDITTDLDKFKDKVTFDWFSNYSSGGSIKKYAYDDPIFSINYWDRAKNIAFSDESYDVYAIPTYKTTTEGKVPNYSILGGIEHGFSEPSKTVSYVTTSIDGRVISSSAGLLGGALKVLDSAADALKSVCLDEKEGIYMPSDEIFINSTMLNTNNSEYIINIAIAPYLGN